MSALRLGVGSALSVCPAPNPPTPHSVLSAAEPQQDGAQPADGQPQDASATRHAGEFLAAHAEAALLTRAWAAVAERVFVPWVRFRGRVRVRVRARVRVRVKVRVRVRARANYIGC